MMVIDNEYEIEETVYLKTDVDQTPRIIISLKVYKKGEYMYELACGTVTSYHYSFEISREENVELKSKAL